MKTISKDAMDAFALGVKQPRPGLFLMAVQEVLTACYVSAGAPNVAKLHRLAELAATILPDELGRVSWCEPIADEVQAVIMDEVHRSFREANGGRLVGVCVTVLCKCSAAEDAPRARELIALAFEIRDHARKVHPMCQGAPLGKETRCPYPANCAEYGCYWARLGDVQRATKDEQERNVRFYEGLFVCSGCGKPWPDMACDGSMPVTGAFYLSAVKGL